MTEEIRNKRVFKRRKDMEAEDINNVACSTLPIKLPSQSNCLSEVSLSSQGQDRSRVETQKSGKGLSANKMKHFKKSLSGEASRLNSQQSEIGQVPAPQPPMQSKSLSMVVTINKTEQDQKEKGSGKMIEFVGLLSVMYAIVVIIFGILLPFVETIKNVWQRSIHTAMFELYVYIVATLFMIYLQIALIDLKCPWGQKKETDDDSATNSSSTLNNNNNNNVDIIEHLTGSNNYYNTDDSKQDYDKRTVLGNSNTNNVNSNNNNNNNNSIENSKLFHSTLSVSDYKDREFSDTYLARKPKYSEVVPPPVTAFLRFNSTTQLATQSISSGTNRAFVQQENARNVEETGRRSDRYPEPKARADLLDEIPKVDEVRYVREEITEEVFIDLTQLGSIFSHHGSSFFLRIGTLMFGVGHMIFTILELENSFKNTKMCIVSTFWWVYLTRFIFVFVQTFVIFKHPAISAKMGNEAVLRFGFMHVIATNLCIWVKTLMSEITLEAAYLSKNHTPQFQGNSPNCTSNSTVLHTLAPYLFPFVLEYSLLCISVIAVMYWSLGEHSKDNIQKGLTNLFKIDVFVVDKEKDDGISSSEDDHERDMFGKSHRGIFFGFILIAGVVIVIAFFNFSITDLVRAEYFYLSSDLSLMTFLLMAVMAGLVLMNPLSFIKKPGSIDDVLLIIAMFGGVMHHVALLMSSFYALSEVQFKEKGLEIIRIINSIASLLFLFGQVILVTSGLRRYPSKHSQVMEKPGRGVVTFLVIANIGSWIFHSMLSNNHKLQYRPANLFGKVPWIILLNLSLPLLLFFFFHSSVCLADIWHQAYTPLHSKLHKPTAPAAADDTVATNAQAVDGIRYNDDIVSTASNLAFVSSQQDLKGTHSKSALDMLNPLIRSVSVSQLSQTPVQPPCSRQPETDSLGGSFPQIPDNPYSSLSRQRAYFSRINKLSPLASPTERKTFDDEHNNNNNNNNVHNDNNNNNNNNIKDDDDDDDDDDDNDNGNDNDNAGDDGYQVRM